MSNNTVLPAGGGGDTVTTVDITTFQGYPTTGKLGASVLYVGATPAPLSNANPLPISDAGGTISIDDGGGSITVDGAVFVSGGVTVSGSVSVTSGTVTANAGSGTFTTAEAPQTSGGVTATKLISAASTNATSIKAAAGQLYGIYATNINANPRYLKIYNKASAPTVGSDTPIQTYLIPGNTTGAGFTRYIPHGIPCSSGIAIAITTGVSDADTGAVAANEIVINLEYK